MAGMTRHIVLLRGINLGKHRKLPMADLRAVLSGLGYTDVATYIQSGNAVLTAEEPDPEAVGAAVRELVTIRQPVEGVPEGLVLQEVAVQDDGFRARLSGTDVRLGG